MISKLKKRFSIVAISVITFVLLIILISVNVISISNNIKRADETLLQVSTMVMNKSGIQNNQAPPSREFDRVFDALLDDDKKITKLTSANANIYSDIDVQALVDQLQLTSGDKKGFVENYRYLIVSSNQVFFLDYTFEKLSETSFLWGSLLIFVLAIGLVAILVILFLKPVLKPIQEAYVKQKRFITDASHEIRTPLTIISTNIQLIEMENNKSEWTESISKQVKRLNQLSESLVTLARMDEDEVRLEKSVINLSDLVNDVLIGFEPSIKASGQTMSTHISDDIRVLGNYDAVEKAFSTIMSNAIKYCSKNGHIETILKTDNRQVILTVTNDAQNLVKGSYNTYFERFYRAEDSRNSETGGFGIGLAIAKSIIEEHQGSIKALSKDGRTFSIVIKLKKY
ncbi:HAMP domain-containing histidine kinase [Acidaminobacter sp. JC074]|uniref:sensor histidine kinase n=1 Tax=Acidaminobacter sp. JC074 TaxID=2530199 RepID=UPI001F0DAFD6|nr:HAMP domain-containing sensor histidine kinase [Acidaminobacter sp. JC074]MCH4891413.1 HAMP domain-containing histidine kinase [Acidaminobacter sp. JC074]